MAGVGLGGLAPQAPDDFFVRSPSTNDDFRDVRRHEPRMRVDNLPASCAGSAARVFSTAFTVNIHPDGPTAAAPSLLQPQPNVQPTLATLPSH